MPTELSICVLGFGSLLEHQYSDNTKHTLQISTQFAPTNFHLPINLTRVISKGKPAEKLTLVIDPNAPTQEPTYYAAHQYKSLQQAIHNLKERENIKTQYIGYYNIVNNRHRSRLKSILPHIKKFCYDHYFDVAIWTDSPPNFRFHPKSPDPQDIQIQKYLRARPRVLRNTQDYLNLLPPSLITRNQLLYRICHDNFIPRH